MLIDCHECGGKVSSEAKNCPTCGRATPMTEWRTRVKETRLTIAGFMALMFINTILGIYKNVTMVQLIIGVSLIALITVGSVWIKPPEQNKP